MSKTPKSVVNGVDWKRHGSWLLAILVVLATFGVGASCAEAQALKLDDFLGQNSASKTVQLVLVLSVLSVAPGLLMMVTCFPRFIIAFSFLRSGEVAGIRTGRLCKNTFCRRAYADNHRYFMCITINKEVAQQLQAFDCCFFILI